jgi:hypothetical protein
MKAWVSSQRARAVYGLRPRETADIPFIQLDPFQGDLFLPPPPAPSGPPPQAARVSRSTLI